MPTMTPEEAEAAAARDYEGIAGQLIQVHELDTNLGEVLYFDPPITVRVTAGDVIRWMDDEHLDPLYTVEPINPEDIPPEHRDKWLTIYGRSYTIANDPRNEEK
jgi:hypothetical protein